MLHKLKIWIYENWFILIFSLLIFLFFGKNIFISALMYFLILFQTRGSFFQSFFLSFIFLPLIYLLKNYLSLSLYLFLPLVFIVFYSLKKITYLNWLIFLISLASIFYFNFLGKISLVFYLIITCVLIIYFSLFFVNNNFLISLAYGLIFFQLLFLVEFLPWGVFTRIIFLILLVFILLRYDIIKKYNGFNSNSY
jgi:hypothetical protein